MTDIKYTENTHAQTGNRPGDSDYEFCTRHGLPTIESQARGTAWNIRRRTDISTEFPFGGGAMASSCGE